MGRGARWRALPVCSRHTFAYVGRSPYDAPPRRRRQPAPRRGADLIEAALIAAAWTDGTAPARRRESASRGPRWRLGSAPTPRSLRIVRPADAPRLLSALRLGRLARAAAGGQRECDQHRQARRAGGRHPACWSGPGVGHLAQQRDTSQWDATVPDRKDIALLLPQPAGAFEASLVASSRCRSGTISAACHR